MHINEASDVVLERIKNLIYIGIPIQGHLGLDPHYLYMIDGFRAVDKNSKEAKKVYNDARRLEEAGV